jgi:hypothetical protein
MMHADSPPIMDLTFEVELVRILKAADKPLDLKTPPPAVFRTRSG